MTNIIISIGLSFLLALVAYIKKAMTNNALLLAFVFSCIITYYGGISSFIILALTFLGTIIASKIGKEKRKQINENKIEKSKQKDILEIIANVMTGTFSIVLFGLTNNIIFQVMYASIMAESLADTLASDIGVLSKKEPFNLRTWEVGEAGLSGNVSILGLFSSFLGSLIIGLIYFLTYKELSTFLIITFSGFLGAIFDSFLGAFIQVKYKCPKCGEITEKKIHCNKTTEYYKGNKKLNNDFVNFLSNIFAGIISLVLFYTIKF